MASQFTFGTFEHATFWLNTEPCGLFCGLIVYLLLLFGEYAVVFVVMPVYLPIETFWGQVNRILFTTLILLAIGSHFRAMTTDPGAVPKDALPLLSPEDEHAHDLENPVKQPQKQYSKCLKCECYKPPRTHHCSICRRCIVKMDHHCPWINNCVGLGNHKFFLLFLLYTFLASAHAFTVILMKTIYCTTHSTAIRNFRRRRHHDPVTEAPKLIDIATGNAEDGRNLERIIDPLCDAVTTLETGLAFAAVVESLLFGLFTLCMMCDQSSVVFTAMTQIDRFKLHNTGRYNSRRGYIWRNIAEVFGGDPNKFGTFSIIAWLFPSGVKHYNREELYGYRVLRQGTVSDREGIVKIPGIGEPESPTPIKSNSHFKQAPEDAAERQRLSLN